MNYLAAHQRDILLIVTLICAVIVFGNGLHFILFRIAKRRQGAERHLGLGIQRHLGRPSRAILLDLGVLAIAPLLPLIPTAVANQIEHYAGLLLVILLGWFAIGGVYVFEAVVHSKFDITAKDNLQARRIHTQMQVFRRLLIGLVLVLDLAAFLWSLHDQTLWKFGTGLMASAGLASLVLATAAKSTASNLIAGMQIAFTEPIRIDDVVVVAGEWGRIAEITSTYVVINIWDKRTLIVPLSYFIEQPFTNWTRSGSDIMGTAFLYVDYSVPVEELRAELQRIVKDLPQWDQKICGLQVTNLSERTMELRCLVGSPNSGANFELRCIVREKMIAFVRDKYPHALPTMRFEMNKPLEMVTPELPAQASANPQTDKPAAPQHT
ncbi:MAG: mechanosensitive ion channel [Acidobacteriota bacterium]|nr:mechanosensitive ion channel [Acidobacteriota bacterium]